MKKKNKQLKMDKNGGVYLTRQIVNSVIIISYQMLNYCFSNTEQQLHKPLGYYKLYESYNLYKIIEHKLIFVFKLFIKTIDDAFFFTIVLSNIALSNHTK